MKTPPAERAAGRRKLAAEHKALPGGEDPIPNLDYLKRAIRSVGRLDSSKRPALRALIRKRAKELGALDAPGVKGTWPFEAANETEGIELATMTRRMPMVRGTADVQASRTGPGAVTVMHKSTGMKVGMLHPAANGGYQGTHADGTKTPAAGSMGGAMAGLISYHNRQAAAKKAGPAAKSYANDGQQALDLAGSLPYTSAASSSDGPRVTSMGAGKKAKAAAPASGMSDACKAIYRKLVAKGMKPAQAAALAKRAAAKASAKAA